MNISLSTSGSPATRPGTLAKHSGCGSQRSGRSRWVLIAAAVALVVIGLVAGSALFGFAAVLPLLYTLPCMLMLAMCLFGKRHSATPGDTSVN